MAATTRRQSQIKGARKALEAAKYAKRALKNSRKALLLDICEGMIESYKHNNNRLPYGHVENLLKALKPKESWMTRNIINKAFMKYRKDQELGTKKSDTVGTNGTNCSGGEIPDSITLGCGSGNVTAESDLNGDDSFAGQKRRGGSLKNAKGKKFNSSKE